jgi:hypothetical protein
MLVATKMAPLSSKKLVKEIDNQVQKTVAEG